MKVIAIADEHADGRRSLVAFRPPLGFPHVAEGKLLVTKEDGVVLGNHSHPHYEGFMLVAGSCTIITWTAAGGRQEQRLHDPIMFMFEPGEEHRVVCGEAGMMLVGYMPVTYEDENNTPATHLD